MLGSFSRMPLHLRTCSREEKTRVARSMAMTQEAINIGGTDSIYFWPMFQVNFREYPHNSGDLPLTAMIPIIRF